MKLSILFCVVIPGILLLCIPLARSNNFFFNGSSLIQVTAVTAIPLNRSFDFKFRTCVGGVLLSQSGRNNGFFLLQVVPTSVNYSVSPPDLISSHLEMSWDTGGSKGLVSLGKNLDQNIIYTVSFTPGTVASNSTLRLAGLAEPSLVGISNEILGFDSAGPLFAGLGGSGGVGFVGCIESGNNMQLKVSQTSIDIKNCSLDQQLGCPQKVCPVGFTGQYCETDINDCAQPGGHKCHHYSDCIDLVNNYTCQCGPRWTGYQCDTYLGSLCNVSNTNNTDICKNGGFCKDSKDKNNYTCTCVSGFTGRNCESKFNACESVPCEQGGTCKPVGADDYECTCPTGFLGKDCDQNIDDCNAGPCGPGICVDGVNNFTCNCTGSGFTGANCNQDIDECLTVKPCNPNATSKCDNYRGTYKCNCVPGFTGKNCYENINDCQGSPCQNGGSCKDKVGGFICECPVGFNGTLCDNNIDDCVSHTCNNFSNCLDGTNNYTCVCKPGYTGSNCTTDIDECASSPCKNGGNCTHGVNWYKCTCRPHFNGSNCEIDVNDDCIPDPCFNNATCVDPCFNSAICVDGSNHFNCTCLPGFEGSRCENETDECLASPCLNNGTCTDKFNNFTCNCSAGYTGHTCAEDIDDCLSSPCNNSATCVDGVNQYTCRCPSGFYGNNCDHVRDACHPNPCRNHANCSFVGDAYNCTCVSGFEGENCSMNIDDCKNNSCVANATCLDGLNNYTCKCPLGYQGEYCHIDIYECASNPCVNNGSCIDGINTYNCSCPEGFNGTRCETNINDCPSHGCNNGTCIDGINNYTCVCKPGFSGLACEFDINECDVQSCNSGTCQNVPGSYRCQCDQWTTGAHCELDIDECSTNDPCNPPHNLCQNCNATIPNQPCQTQKGYECFCRNGFTGRHCEIQVDECKQYTPCLNGATCVDKVANYSCTCAPGYAGRNCSIDIDECEFGFCQNGATCRDLINGYNCTCVAGYTDHNCSTNIDECEGDPCGYGNCTDLINAFNCSCFPGYTGDNCSTEIDECASDPCQNNGTCVDLVAAVNCSCTANYTGEFCEHKVSSCSPVNPCLNNGSCVEKNFNYTCSCVPGYGGAHCENITTIGLNGSSYMSFYVGETTFALSFQFRTTLSHGLLAADSSGNVVTFLEGNVVRVIYNGTSKVSAGRTADLSNGVWHRVVVNISADTITLQVDNSSCGQDCESSAPLPVTRPIVTNLFIGGSSQTLSQHRAMLYNFTGCIQDVMIDNLTVVPTEVGVELLNSRVGCGRTLVCASSPCVHGLCVDEWIKYSCECTRPWVGSDCNTSLIPGTFGATEPLNSMPSRQRRDVGSMRNASYAKFLTNNTSFGVGSEFSFFIRTREVNGFISLMTDGVSNHIAVGIIQGAVVFQVTLQGHKTNLTLAGNVSDGSWHFVQVQGNVSRFDNRSQDIVPVVDRDVPLNVTYLGGLEHFSLFPGASLVRTPLRGCVQDVRLNNKLFDFRFDSASFSEVRYLLLDQGNVGQGCAGMNVCRTDPCGEGGYCRDLWNKFECDCKPRYGAKDCSLYGCSLVNLCPGNATCLDVNENYECVHPATFNASATRAQFTLTYSGVVKPDVSLRMRTRQSTTDLLVVQKENDFIRMTVDNGRVNVSFKVGADSGQISSDVAVNDGGWHTVVFNITNNKTQLTVDSLTDSGSTWHQERSLSALLNGTAVLLGGHSVFKGCLDNVRIGGLLLPFVDYYNSILNVSHVTPQQPHFDVNATGLRLGCYSDNVCSVSPCIRGICSDVWNQFACACPEGWAGPVCNLTANMTCAHSPCVNGTCVNVTDVDTATNESQISDVGYDMFYCNCSPGFEGKQCKNETNECSVDPCKNGANCTDLHLNYTCACVVGFTGRDCETNIDDCQNHNCSSHGTCVDGVNSYNCSCSPGFEGTFCGKDIDECLEHPPFGPCNATGTTNCTNGVGNFTCRCKEGYFGDLCEFDPSMACVSNPCRNGGTCRANSTGFNCSCPAGFNGTFCQFDIHECKDEPCYNNGTCIDSHRNASWIHFVGYNCSCTVDYEGRRCEEKIDPCNLYPCKNNATCERLAYNRYQCNCTPAYDGENCTMFLPCHSSPCKNGATCNALDKNYTCACALGYHGRNCENEVDFCSPDPCRNNATCVNLNTQGKYYCNCTEGYGNANCSGLLRYCQPGDPCVNGTCIPLMDRFKCDCNPGFQGEKCNELINKCDSSPCRHGGTCTPEVDSYACSCTDDWVGQQCNISNPCKPQPCENGATCEVDRLLGNHTCVCLGSFTGETCETPLEPTDPGENSGESSAALIGGIVTASLLVILVIILILFVLAKKRSANGTYNPSKLEVEGGRVELDNMMKPPPPERLI